MVSVVRGAMIIFNKRKKQAIFSRQKYWQVMVISVTKSFAI